MSKIAIIRIKGRVGLKSGIDETLNRLRLKTKYSCVVLEDKPEVLGMIKKVKDFVAYGEIDEATYKELKEKRGIKDSNKKGQLKPYFRLHPPRGSGGIETKKHFGQGKGVLGNHKDKINELIRRML